jgi:hypothetical protein
MPRKVTPRPAPTAEALYDWLNGKLWIEYPGGESVQIGSASNKFLCHYAPNLIFWKALVNDCSSLAFSALKPWV